MTNLANRWARARFWTRLPCPAFAGQAEALREERNHDSNCSELSGFLFLLFFFCGFNSFTVQTGPSQSDQCWLKDNSPALLVCLFNYFFLTALKSKHQTKNTHR